MKGECVNKETTHYSSKKKRHVAGGEVLHSYKETRSPAPLEGMKSLFIPTLRTLWRGTTGGCGKEGEKNVL